MNNLNLQKELKFIHSQKINTSDKESLLFRLLNITQTTLSNYANSETKKFYLKKIKELIEK